MRTFLVAAATAALVLTSVGTADAATQKTYKVSISTSKTSSTAGAFVKISGKVSNAKIKGSSVTIQRLYVGGSWTTVASAKLSKKGKYSASVETPLGGTTRFRVLKARSSKGKAGSSATKSLPVYTWLSLTRQPEKAFSSGFWEKRPAKLGGTTYPRSLAFPTSNVTLIYKIDKLCTRITTRVGMEDGATGTGDVGAEAASLAADFSPATTVLAPSTFTNGQSVNINTPITGTYLFITSKTVASGKTLVYGNPQVYCNAPSLQEYVLDIF